MKKVKITVLKTTLDAKLAQEYGSDGLTVCPMLKEGQIFMPTMQNQMVFATKRGKRFISMCLLWHMVGIKKCFIMAIGLKSLALQFVVVMMACDRLYLSWKQQTTWQRSSMCL